ncbi:hypothetical protein [Mesorhizobium sp. M2E.F.Ca.ET.209.01.1.1]|uniref:hypothetical protein n=1 Tax=Mesorhizobium sp. M2E.F.Ca.ET.209.01.1.1 TaxID=2500526 RepID=UPI001FEF17A7|nr:hypothetical protein [Mesorhizobium sp. M2E.F.Ca.ET.209.01.1.1]
METMIDTSIAVTAKVSTNVPYGSPTRRATASAWSSTTKMVVNMIALESAPTSILTFSDPSSTERPLALTASAIASAANGIV